MTKIKDDRIGEVGFNNKGLKMWIIGYRNSMDLDIKFEDGYISYNKHYSAFKNGQIDNPNYYNKRIGESGMSYQGLKMKIIEYKNSTDMTVEFENGYIVKTRYSHFKSGKIENHLHPTLFGVGYLGEKGSTKSPKEIELNLKKRCYSIWRGMLERCYSKEYHLKKPTYKECSVCEEWHNFQNFAKWYDENYYEIMGEVIHLDKDILVKGNKVYSPETCVFAPCSINVLFSDYINKTHIKKNKENYKVLISKHNKKVILGYSDTYEEALMIYKNGKESYIKQVADEYKDRIPKKLYNAMYNYKIEITI